MYLIQNYPIRYKQKTFFLSLDFTLTIIHHIAFALQKSLYYLPIEVLLDYKRGTIRKLVYKPKIPYPSTIKLKEIF